MLLLLCINKRLLNDRGTEVVTLSRGATDSRISVLIIHFLNTKKNGVWMRMEKEKDYPLCVFCVRACSFPLFIF